LAAKVNFEIDGNSTITNAHLHPVNVSVFETSIRIVGGLLSSHILATINLGGKYAGEVLLKQAIIVADKLLVAFNTPTVLPYGTVNLMHGVPKDETPVVCTACAGTFQIEFAWLSLLKGDPK
jgi:mannosidase alpha-like ER degradation enhancer 2